MSFKSEYAFKDLEVDEQRREYAKLLQAYERERKIVTTMITIAAAYPS